LDRVPVLKATREGVSTWKWDWYWWNRFHYVSQPR